MTDILIHIVSSNSPITEIHCGIDLIGLHVFHNVFESNSGRKAKMSVLK